ncbi:hypothetical protein CXF83_06450 [Shewanella sp. Choline-02u-19]|jgi:hypothetical protein|uniref:hypothetical protein n=1 Tax=unclassified Shewanella TaxID=196818 RepID=UPI000C337E21|nr:MULTISPECIES: hypothetical protein [unclassified Shewanella]PKG58560.1 hypothetical protein CXF82_03975 [Shewanella sp. GutDb-MelDb]PKG75995.1 hypothetical protein CXF86_03545 [Shewanella sp. GutCb]PKH56722.1 hypothetical protein CXF84_12470 [Shewanella sp. Bg11-22]PKI30273.1 hypothetical protein CXF83_06450 [Shewanella sp. Choline-02u-19]
MKHSKLYCAFGLGSLLLFGCGSDDNKTVEPPIEPPVPPVTTIGINETDTLSVSLKAVDGASGNVALTLTGDDDKLVTDASGFNLIIMGYPKEGDSSVKYKLAWHQANNSNCIEDEECTLAVTEAEPGVYNLELDAIEWKDAIDNYRVAVEVKGEKAHLELAFLD